MSQSGKRAGKLPGNIAKRKKKTQKRNEGEETYWAAVVARKEKAQSCKAEFTLSAAPCRSEARSPVASAATKEPKQLEAPARAPPHHGTAPGAARPSKGTGAAISAVTLALTPTPREDEQRRPGAAPTHAVNAGGFFVQRPGKRPKMVAFASAAKLEAVAPASSPSLAPRPTPSQPPRKQEKRRDDRAAMVALYRASNPTKVAEVDGLLAKYAGHLAKMWVKLSEKYGHAAVAKARGS